MGATTVICAVRQKPEPEITEISVPAFQANSTIRRLNATGWETIFVMRIYNERRRNGNPN